MNRFIFSALSLFFCLSIINHSQAETVWDKIQENYAGALDITVYHSPSCGCCKDWISHLEKHDFSITNIEIDDMSSIKRKYNLPTQVASCHTAIIDDYIIEGHVPADDIKRLLKQRPEIRGLSVPQMPIGTPGMEMGSQKDPFVVVSFDDEGNVLPFNQYWDY